MPINSHDLMEAIGTLAELEGVKVALSTSAKGAAICGTACFVGGLVGGSVGMAVGGTIGALSAGYITRGSFRPILDVIKNDMSDKDREKLKDNIETSLAEFQPSDISELVRVLTENNTARQAVISTVVAFITNEMQLQIVD